MYINGVNVTIYFPHLLFVVTLPAVMSTAATECGVKSTSRDRELKGNDVT